MRCIDKGEVIKICEEAELLPKQILDKASIQSIELSDEAPMLTEYLGLNVYDLATDDRLVEVHIGMEALNDVLEYTDVTKTYKEIYVLDRLKGLITTLLQEEKHYDIG